MERHLDETAAVVEDLRLHGDDPFDVVTKSAKNCNMKSPLAVNKYIRITCMRPILHVDEQIAGCKTIITLACYRISIINANNV